jgi:hypothetical protein
MTVKHDLKHLAWVYNHIESNKLALMLYHRVLASLTSGKQTDNGVRYSCFISMNDLLDVDPEFDKISNFIEEKQWKLKVEKILSEMFEGKFIVKSNGYFYYQKFIVDGIGIEIQIED